jgi:hypothetical protein
LQNYISYRSQYLLTVFNYTQNTRCDSLHSFKERCNFSSYMETNKRQGVKYKTSLTSIPTSPSGVNPVFTNRFLLEKIPLHNFTQHHGYVHYICSHFIKQNPPWKANSPLIVTTVKFIPEQKYSTWIMMQHKPTPQLTKMTQRTVRRRSKTALNLCFANFQVLSCVICTIQGHRDRLNAHRTVLIKVPHFMEPKVSLLYSKI